MLLDHGCHALQLFVEIVCHFLFQVYLAGFKFYLRLTYFARHVCGLRVIHLVLCSDLLYWYLFPLFLRCTSVDFYDKYVCFQLGSRFIQA
jgi:hypothetical protein